MKNRINIDEEVRKTMNVLDRLERVGGNPFLMTRLQERMEEEKAAPKRPQLQWANMLRVAAVALLLVINILSFSKMMTANSQEASITEVLASEYGWAETDNTSIFYGTQN